MTATDDPVTAYAKAVECGEIVARPPITTRPLKKNDIDRKRAWLRISGVLEK